MASDQAVVIVTGGGSGLGAAIADAFAVRGALVVVADVVRIRAEQVASSPHQRGLSASPVEVDVSQGAQVREHRERSLDWVREALTGSAEVGTSGPSGQQL